MTGDKIEKENMVFAHLSDLEMAGKVRMLMRGDLDHEAVCCGSRDRIMYLSQEVERLNAMVTYDCREPGVCPDLPAWIQADLLPESDTTVLMCMPDSDNPVGVGFHDGEKWFDYNGAPLIGNDAVNYWMMLPEPKVSESV